MKKVGVIRHTLTHFTDMMEKNLGLPQIPLDDIEAMKGFDYLFYFGPTWKEVYYALEPVVDAGVKLITVWTGQVKGGPYINWDNPEGLELIKRLTYKHVCPSEINQLELKLWWGIDAELILAPLDWTNYNPEPVPDHACVPWYCMLQNVYHTEKMLSILIRSQAHVIHYGDSRLAPLERDMRKIYRRCSHYLYLVHHSGLSAGVMEMNLMGRTSITNYPHPCTNVYTDNVEDIVEMLKSNYQVSAVYKTRDYIRSCPSWRRLWGESGKDRELVWDDER